MDNNPSRMAEIPVYDLNEFTSKLSQDDKNDIHVLIATPENVMNAIEASLDGVGLIKHTRIDSIRWAKMQEMAFSRTNLFIPISSYTYEKNTEYSSA